MFSLDLQSRAPIYEQMKKKIIELIMLGDLKPGEQLPSVRSLAKEIGVNPNTVQKAYAELEREGLMLTMAGRGSVVADFSGRENPVKISAEKQLTTALSNAKLCGVGKKQATQMLEQVYEEVEGL